MNVGGQGSAVDLLLKGQAPAVPPATPLLTLPRPSKVLRVESVAKRVGFRRRLAQAQEASWGEYAAESAKLMM